MRVIPQGCCRQNARVRGHAVTTDRLDCKWLFVGIGVAVVCPCLLLPRGCPDDDAAMAEAATEQTAKPNGGETGKEKERGALDHCYDFCIFESPICSILVPPCGFCCIAMLGSSDPGEPYWKKVAKAGGDVAARRQAIQQERKECCKDLAKLLLTVVGLGIITSCIKCCRDIKKLTSERKIEAANMRIARWLMFAPYECCVGADPEVISVPGLIEKKVAPDDGGAPPAADADDSLVCWLAGVPPEADAMER